MYGPRQTAGFCQILPDSASIFAPPDDFLRQLAGDSKADGSNTLVSAKVTHSTQLVLLGPLSATGCADQQGEECLTSPPVDLEMHLLNIAE